MVTTGAVLAALAEVADPEIPAISIVDLGLVHRVEVGDAPNEAIHVRLLPTYVGCPALDAIRNSVVDRLGVLGLPVEVEFTYAVPWTTDRLTPSGLSALRRSGIAPPSSLADVRCPYCSSTRVTMDSAFGPTQCRSLFYCRDCRQPFEAFKPI